MTKYDPAKNLQKSELTHYLGRRGGNDFNSGLMLAKLIRLTVVRSNCRHKRMDNGDESFGISSATVE